MKRTKRTIRQTVLFAVVGTLSVPFMGCKAECVDYIKEHANDDLFHVEPAHNVSNHERKSWEQSKVVVYTNAKLPKTWEEYKRFVKEQKGEEV